MGVCWAWVCAHVVCMWACVCVRVFLSFALNKNRTFIATISLSLIACCLSPKHTTDTKNQNTTKKPAVVAYGSANQEEEDEGEKKEEGSEKRKTLSRKPQNSHLSTAIAVRRRTAQLSRNAMILVPKQRVGRRAGRRKCCYRVSLVAACASSHPCESGSVTDELHTVRAHSNVRRVQGAQHRAAACPQYTVQNASTIYRVRTQCTKGVHNDTVLKPDKPAQSE
jgi:hypothetical protein